MLRLRDIMTHDVITVSPEFTVRETMELLAKHHVSGAPVVSGTKVVGVISAADLLSFAATLPGVPTERPERSDGDELECVLEEDESAEPTGMYFTELWSDAGAEVNERFDDVSGPEWNALEEHTVSEVMTRQVLSLPSGTEVPQAAEYMRRAGVHRLLVIDDGRLSGIVSAMDITKAVADRRLVNRTFVFNRDRDFDERSRPSRRGPGINRGPSPRH
ncbi:MAG TPA: CBS domain-containing protein [Gemmatimonadaceae bacterium]|nr:CBS domain-containing protein [Gemmatimonadaceae bacterium]